MKTTHICEILSMQEIAKDTFDCCVQFPEPAEPGQFIHVLCGEAVLLRRPISICDSGENWLRFIFQVRGQGTELLAQKKEGDTLDILGPLGQGFNAEKRGDGTAILVGGGIGIFPLIKLAKRLGHAVESITGFRTKDLIVLKDEFEKICDTAYIATDDGSFGHHGLVTDVLKERVEKGGVSAIYCCGPIPMMKAVKQIALENDIYCELSMEQRMGCGIGACAVCTCKSNGSNVKVCQNGPVFNAKEVDL